MQLSDNIKAARSLQKSSYADLNYPNKKQYVAFPSYTCMSSFAEREGCKNILEIGTGLSTAMWASYGGVEIASLRNHIDSFQSKNCSLRRRYKVKRAVGHWNWSAHELMTDASTLSLPRKLLDIFSEIDKKTLFRVRHCRPIPIGKRLSAMTAGNKGS